MLISRRGQHFLLSSTPVELELGQLEQENKAQAGLNKYSGCGFSNKPLRECTSMPGITYLELELDVSLCTMRGTERVKKTRATMKETLFVPRNF